METITHQMRTRGYGVAVTGTGLDANYGLAQCYGRIYLDGCFMRKDNYTFYDQYLGPEDRHVCRNRTTKSTLFSQNARRAVQQAIENTPSTNGSAYAQVLVPGSSNDTTYILADCSKILSINSCTVCLQNASASMLGCLPWSKGRALYIGYFMRYSNTNFLNAILTSGGLSSREKVVVIVIVVSSVIILGVGAFIGIVVWKNKQNQKKRKGLNDVEKLVKILHDIILNFKYSILDKATRSFDEANKLEFDISKLFVASRSSSKTNI
ncbi:putative protein ACCUMULATION AND REPLICATION OF CHLOROPLASTS 3-like [Capsicum annuum]|nr:putative protein ACCUMULATION AND REPLICATION OF CHLOROPLASTS 3-like [Capsicum annuum]